MRILAISGSLRRDSYNTQLLRAAEELAPPGIEIELYEELARIPPFDHDRQSAEAPDVVLDLRKRIVSAHALLISTPEYNTSIPGQLKNALDWASVPFPDNSLRSQTVAVIGASTGSYGAAWAQAELRKVLGASGARVVDGKVAVPRAHEQFDAEGRLATPRLREQLAQALRDLVETAQPVGVARG